MTCKYLGVCVNLSSKKIHDESSLFQMDSFKINLVQAFNESTIIYLVPSLYSFNYPSFVYTF